MWIVSESEVAGMLNFVTFGAVVSEGGGGGGGGGGPVSQYSPVKTVGLTTTAGLYVDKTGATQYAVNVSFDNGNVGLGIGKGTKMTYVAGNALDKLSIAKVDPTPAPPAGKSLLQAYDFGPEGAKFSPALTLTMKYDPAKVVTGSKIQIYSWDGIQWVGLDSQTDAAGAVKCDITHFSRYALIAEAPAPATFTVGVLQVSADKIKPDETVTIQADVSNSGGSQGKYTVILKVNGQEAGSTEVTLDGGKSQTVKFEVKRNEPGEYVLDLNGSKGKFTVVAPATSTPLITSIPTLAAPQSSPTSNPVETQKPAAAAPSPVETLPPTPAAPPTRPVKSGIPPWVWIVLAAVLVAAAAGLIVYRARRGKKAKGGV